MPCFESGSVSQSIVANRGHRTDHYPGSELAAVISQGSKRPLAWLRYSSRHFVATQHFSCFWRGRALSQIYECLA
jgi:hypothetical protein